MWLVRWGRGLWHWIVRLVGWAFRLAFALVFMIGLQRDEVLTNTRAMQIERIVRSRTFDFLTWEVNAITAKLRTASAGVAVSMSEADRSAFIVAYLHQIAEFQTVEGQIARIYADPNVGDPNLESEALRTRRAEIEAILRRDTPIAEHIIESQVASVLRDEGFAIAGEVLPPVAAKFQPLPQLLVTSPRDRIQYETGTVIDPALVDQNVALENRVEAEQDVSALVVPLGGLGTYPAMVLQTWNANFLFETVAHEWSHNYLIFFPLGWNYDAPETRIINETAATLFGRVIGAKAIRRYYQVYPQMIAQLPSDLSSGSSPAVTASPTPVYVPQPDESRPFDAGAFMNTTRVTVDFLLHFGLVDQAERYMEGQRRVFTAYGYSYRRINQAFFAFYGGYQGAGGNYAGGNDPIGDQIRQVYTAAGGSRAFLERIRGITSRAELMRLIDQ